MTLLTKLEDSEEGLIGITEKEEKVHLGAPIIYSDITMYQHTFVERAHNAFSLTCIKDEHSQEGERLKKFEEELENYQKDERAYWYINFPDSPLSSVSNQKNDICFGYVSLRFEKEKEEAFQRGASSYPVGPNYNKKWVKIMGKEK